MSDNVWMKTFGVRVAKQVRGLEELKLRGTDGTVPINELVMLFKSSQQEIIRLQVVNDDLVKVLDRKEKQIEKLGGEVTNV